MEKLSNCLTERIANTSRHHFIHIKVYFQWSNKLPFYTIRVYPDQVNDYAKLPHVITIDLATDDCN
jgi:hypothetical protein